MVLKSIYYRNANDYIMRQSGLNISSFTHVKAPVRAFSVFTDIKEVQLPLVIRGRLLTVGQYREPGFKSVTLEKETLRESVNDWVGVKIYTSHGIHEKVRRGQDVSINSVLGKIVSTSWNENDGAIDFDAEIYDLNVAYKIVKGIINSISVGFSRDIPREGGRYVYRNIEPVEASLVHDPKDPNAVFNPVM